jgi:hypothetical protein
MDGSLRARGSCVEPGVSLSWTGASAHCSFYFTKIQTRAFGVDVSDWGLAGRAIDAAVCGVLPIAAWRKVVCLVYAALYEFYTIDEINKANLVGVLELLRALKLFFGLITGDAHLGYVGKTSGCCKP